MESLLNNIVQNAQTGTGHCKGCPAHEDTNGAYVNPGLLDPSADLMFLTMDPSHTTEWSRYTDWSQYNEEKSQLFIDEWPGGKSLPKLLDGIPGITINDIWLADAVKCPVNNDLAGSVDTDAAFDHCKHYLEEEIEALDPKVIIAMGEDPARQVLNGLFGYEIGKLKTGSRDPGTLYDTNPPVVVSPHWGHGWLGKNNNRAKVREAILDVL